MMDGRGKSDSPIVPRKPPNKTGQPVAEAVEGRGLAKGNPLEQNALRTQSRAGASSALERVRQAARRDRRQRFTALLHHVYDVQRLRCAYFALKRDASAGVDGETWRSYGQRLEENLQRLSERLRRGAYIAKTDGRLRPLGVPALEDKLVQRTVVEVLNAIYETDFLGFSYGFRPGRSPHRALDALSVGGPDWWRTMYLATVDSATSWPSKANFAWMRGAPQSRFSWDMPRIRSRISGSIFGRPRFYSRMPRWAAHRSKSSRINTDGVFGRHSLAAPCPAPAQFGTFRVACQ